MNGTVAAVLLISLVTASCDGKSSSDEVGPKVQNKLAPSDLAERPAISVSSEDSLRGYDIVSVQGPGYSTLGAMRPDVVIQDESHLCSGGSARLVKPSTDDIVHIEEILSSSRNPAVVRFCMSFRRVYTRVDCTDDDASFWYIVRFVCARGWDNGLFVVNGGGDCYASLLIDPLKGVLIDSIKVSGY